MRPNMDEGSMTSPPDYQRQKLKKYYSTDHLAGFSRDGHFAGVEGTTLYVGCGRGETIVSRPGWYGIDFNPDLVKLWEKLKISNRCQVGDARDLPFTNNHFDWTVSCDFLEHIQHGDLLQVASELRRVASRGQHVIHMTKESKFRGVTGESLHPAGDLSIEDWVKVLDADVQPLHGNWALARW